MEHTICALSEVLDRLSVERAHWLGYSMGGRIALAAAIALPERTLSLTVESGSPGLPTPGERVERLRSDEALARRIEGEGVEAFIDYWESLPLWTTQATLSQAARRRLRSQRLANSPAGLACSLRGVGVGAQPPLHRHLARLRRPVLFIASEEDSRFVAIAQQMHKAVAGSRLCIVAGAGHAVHLERPRAFNRAVIDFLRFVDASRNTAATVHARDLRSP
jgi:2-succinyl-6-hydroxy-2,4-cyclohexadiene-1-carboxylate synthase